MTTICKSMKSLVSIPKFLTVIVVAGVIALIPLSPLPLSASSDSDESETNAEQRLGQKNLGSGESDNFNCDENMITSASGVDCIPSGPAPPTPPPTVITIITGNAVGTISCEGEEEATAGLGFFADVAEDGTVTGSVNIEVLNMAIVTLAVTGGTTDGNTFSLSGESGFCSEEPFTVTGDCGVGGSVRYEDPNGIGNFGSADVACTVV